MGNWTLLCTTSTGSKSIGLDLSRLPGPIKSLQEKLTENSNKYVTVKQKILSTKEDGIVDRIDHVIEYSPPSELQDLFKNLPEQITKLNINPLQVSESKLVLIHKASVDTEKYPVRTRLALTSVVLNAAGTSTLLDPNGADLLGFNLPLGEFINAGDFETTYIDDTLRISRGKQGLVDQVRVFTRMPEQSSPPITDEETNVEAGGSGSSDVSPSDVETDT